MPNYVDNGTAEVSEREISEEEDYNSATWKAATKKDTVVDSEGRLRLVETIPVIDDFEDGDISSYAGETGSFEVNSNPPVPESSFSLKKTGGPSNAAIVSFPSDSTNLDFYPSRGDKVTYKYVPDTGENFGGIVLFAESGRSTSDLSGYVFLIDSVNNNFFGSDDLVIRRYDSGSVATIKSGGDIPLRADDEYLFTIRSNASDFKMAVENLTQGGSATITVSDSTYSGQGTGWKGREGDVYDIAEVSPDTGL